MRRTIRAECVRHPGAIAQLSSLVSSAASPPRYRRQGCRSPARRRPDRRDATSRSPPRRRDHGRRVAGSRAPRADDAQRGTGPSTPGQRGRRPMRPGRRQRRSPPVRRYGPSRQCRPGTTHVRSAPRRRPTMGRIVVPDPRAPGSKVIGVPGDVIVEHVRAARELAIDGHDVIDASEDERTCRAGAVAGDRVVDHVQIAIEIDISGVAGAALAVERRRDPTATRPTPGMAPELGLAIVPAQRLQCSSAIRGPRPRRPSIRSRRRTGGCAAHRKDVELDTPGASGHERLEMEAVADDRDVSGRPRQPDRRRAVGARSTASPSDPCAQNSRSSTRRAAKARSSPPATSSAAYATSWRKSTGSCATSRPARWGVGRGTTSSDELDVADHVARSSSSRSTSSITRKVGCRFHS